MKGGPTMSDPIAIPTFEVEEARWATEIEVDLCLLEEMEHRDIVPSEA